jgi:hypothetical protein
MSDSREDVPALGNKAVVDMLEQVLAEARKGKMCHIGVIMSQHPASHGIGIAGEVALGEVCKAGIVDLINQIDARNKNGIMPPRDESLGENYVTYNMVVCPVSFDYLFWLVDALMRMKAAGLPGPLKVAFWKGQDGIGRLNEPIIRQFFDGVLRPLLPLFGAVEVSPAKFMGRCKNLYVPRDIVDYVKEGQKVPMAKAPGGAKLEVALWLKKRGISNPVVITLREAQHWDHRNSNIDAWLRFAQDLERQDEQVVIVRDTRRAMDGLPGWNTYPEAALDLHIRTALYEAAKANLFVANGPAALAMFVDRSTFSFTPLEPDGHTYFPNTPQFWQANMGISPPDEDRFPWFRPDQFLVYGHDTYENICAAWERLRPMLQGNGVVHSLGHASHETNPTVGLSVAETRKDTFG